MVIVLSSHHENEWITRSEIETGEKANLLRTDVGSEYMGTGFQEWWKSRGMHLHWQLVSRSATGTGSPSHIIPFRPHPIHHHHYGCPLALGLARLYPSVRQHILNQVQNNKVPDPSDINDRFESLIEMPLSTLNDVPVIVIDGLDDCGGLRHDASAKDDNKDLLYMLKCWAQVNHLKRFKLIITSW